MSKCEDLESLIAVHVDGALAAAQQERLAGHLAGCARCREAVQTQQEVRAALQSRPEASVPAGFHARLAARLAREQSARRLEWGEPAKWRLWTYRLAPVAAALTLIAVLHGLLAPASADAELSPLVQAWAVGEERETLPVTAAFWQNEVDAHTLFLAVLTGRPDSSFEEYEYER